MDERYSAAVERDGTGHRARLWLERVDVARVALSGSPSVFASKDPHLLHHHLLHPL